MENYKEHINQRWKTELLPFPDIYPLPVSTFVNEGTEAMNCSPHFINCAVLAVASIAVGNNSNVEVKKGWIEGANLILAIVGESGYKKTPALQLALTPIYQIQKEYKAAFLVEKQEYLTTIEAMKKEKIAGAKPAPPKLQQIVTTDATMEAIGQLLHDNSFGILLWKDELIAWLKSMNQYKGGSGEDMEKYLSFWSRTLVIINRVTKGEPLQIDSPFITIVGGIQDDLLKDLGVLKDNGFVNRILFSYPEPLANAHTDVEISDSVSNAYNEFIINLFNMQQNQK